MPTIPSKSDPTAAARPTRWQQAFPLAFGAFLGLALLKFCNPPIMDKFVVPPTNGYEWLFSSWPNGIGYWLLMLVAVGGIFTAGLQIRAPRWLIALPLVWLVWQLISATQTVDAELTQATLKHFVACVACFYLGLFCLNREEAEHFFLGPLALAFAVVVVVGLNQHFGGLRETRDYFFAYLYPTMKDVPPEYLKKLSSDRIFSTVFYPNALAGAILLLLPPLLAWVWQAKKRFTIGARSFLCGVLAVGAMACLYWSGSKGGWLLALAGGLVILLNQGFSRRLKLVLVCAVLAIGGAGFVWKYAGFFERGATSVVARFDYWEAAWKTAVAKPTLGSGPGTFGVVYAAIKKPESEMARLTHNDYLQQASDSGFPGLAAYSIFIVGMLWFGYRAWRVYRSPLRLGIWVGLLVWSVQALGEFTLYVPSLSWTAFAFAGWLLGSVGKRFDKPVTGA
jgi:O-antigen ligase